MHLLVCEDIVKKYSNHLALDRVSIHVPRGCVYGLLGPNGAGKTSLIRIINQITGPDSGNVMFDGRKIVADDTARVGYLPEERGLYKKMKVGEQAVYLGRLKGLSKAEARKRLKEWFEKFEMTAWWDKKIEELSKGMQQKVQFIVTLLHDPELLILDEPFSGFDPINANLIKNELLEQKKRGKTIIFSTHNMSSVEELCDEIALIHKSKTILEGNVNEVRQAHKPGIFELEFKGNFMGFTNALWTGFELLEKTEGKPNKARIRLLGKSTPNDLLAAVLPVAEVVGLREIIHWFPEKQKQHR
jgi:ABC-2 type transport system ATP-binding protein